MLISFKALALAPVTALALVFADHPASASPLPAPSTDKIWVTARHSISIEQLSYALAQDPNLLAKLNYVETSHTFNPSDWIVLPSELYRQVRQIAQIDTSELRRTPPLQSLAPVEERAVVRFGDTVVKIAQRYGLTLRELLRLNPGLETARLVVGTQIRLSESSTGRTRLVQGLKSTSSDGISWPEDPGFRSTSGGESSIGLVGPLLVGPFKRNPSAFARFLNSQPRIWEDPSLRTYFYDLYKCSSFPAGNSTAMAPSYRCDGGYVSYSDNLGSRRCRLNYVSWTWDKGQAFEVQGCR
jgi:LysM repeat protein